MSTPFDIFDAIIQPIREADEREGNDFLYRYLRGHQYVWETTRQKILDIRKLWSVTECPDEYLQYLKWIVGFTSELDYLTDDLDFDELRRLISIAGRLWKQRGAESTITDVMFFATGARNRTWNWFDFRWIVGETSLEEAHQGWDPWIIGTDEETESNLRIVDDGALNRTLVVNLLKLLRATNEKWEITYLAFLDQFLRDGDTTQWRADITDAPSLAVADGVMSLTDDTQVERTWTIVGEERVEFSAFFRLKGSGNLTKAFGYEWNVDSGGDRYFARVSPNAKKITFFYMNLGTPVQYGQANLSGWSFLNDVYYGHRIVSTTEEGTKRRHRVYLDGVLIFSFLFTTGKAAGAVGVFHDIDRTVECSEVEVARLPEDSDYIDINS